MLQIIPLKSTKYILLQESFAKWIDNSHPHYSSSQCQEDISRLQSLHSDISNSISVDSGHSLALSNRGLEDLVEYHACLVECERRGFPTCGLYAQVNGSIDARLEFWWKDAFVSNDGHDEDSLTTTTKSHLHYERACVLWNIAALHSFRASQQDWSTKEGRTVVHLSYLLAARLFRYIRMELLKDTSPATITSDMTSASLSMCESICFAQGQFCAYEALKIRLAQDPSSVPSHTLLAKLAAGVAQHYEDALSFSQDSSLKSQLPNTSKEYGKHCKMTSMLFRARAEYLTSRVAFLKSEFGVEIGRLRKARDMCQEALKFVDEGGGCGDLMTLHGPLMLGNVYSSLQTLLRTISQRRTVVSDENKSIYHESIPDAKSLENVVGTNVVVVKAEEEEELPIELMPECLERPFFTSLPDV